VEVDEALLRPFAGWGGDLEVRNLPTFLYSTIRYAIET